MSTTPITKEQDQFICDWFDNLDADYIRQLQELNDECHLTPRRAYHLVFGDLSGVCTCKACLLPGQKDPGASLAAPAQVTQAEGTLQARFIFSDPDGRFRRLCHVLPSRFCCSLDLPGTGSFRGERQA